MSTLCLDTQTMYQQLLLQRSIVASYGPVSISLKFEIEDDSILIQSTLFSDGDYLPPSVRYAVIKKHYLFNAYLPCKIYIDEDTATVELTYQGPKPISPKELKEVVEDFALVAEKWHEHLLKQAEKDLMYIVA